MRAFGHGAFRWGEPSTCPQLTPGGHRAASDKSRSPRPEVNAERLHVAAACPANAARTSRRSSLNNSVRGSSTGSSSSTATSGNFQSMGMAQNCSTRSGSRPPRGRVGSGVPAGTRRAASRSGMGVRWKARRTRRPPKGCGPSSGMLVAAEAVRVAAAVEPFVVPADQRDRVLQRFERLDHLHPLGGVLLDDGVLGRRQRSRACSRIASGTLILPMSCRMPPRRSLSQSVRGRPTPRPAGRRSG